VFVMSRLSPLMTRIWPLCCYVEPFGVVGVLEVELFTVEDFAGDAELEEAVRGGGELTVDWGLPGLLQDGGVVGTHGQLEAVREQERDQSGDWFALVFPKAHDLVQGVGQNRDHPGVAGGGFPGQNHTGCDWMKFVRCPGCLLNSQGWITALAVADVIGEGDVFAPVGRDALRDLHDEGTWVTGRELAPAGTARLGEVCCSGDVLRCVPAFEGHKAPVPRHASCNGHASYLLSSPVNSPFPH
jgi:hypothetical protein